MKLLYSMLGIRPNMRIINANLLRVPVTITTVILSLFLSSVPFNALPQGTFGDLASAANQDHRVYLSIVPGAASKAGRAFSPSPATVNIGDTVTWVNNDSAIHTVTSGTDNTPDSEFGLKDDGKPMLIFPGRTFEYAATQAATFHYFCWLHPTMIGTLQVSNSSSSSPPMSQISLSTDRSLLYGDDEVTIQGTVVGVNSTGQLLLLRVLDPEGEEFLSDSVAIDDDGNFTYPLEISGPLGIPGQYHVTALYNGVRAETSFSYVSSKDSDWSTAKLDLQTSDIRYRISGGSLLSLAGDPSTTTITATIDADDNGTLTIQLPRTIADSKAMNGTDIAFVAFVDGIAAVVDEDKGQTVRTLQIPFTDNSEKIEIQGTFLVSPPATTTK